MKYKLAAVLLGCPIIVESAPPQTAIEPPCTRATPSVYVGESFTFPDKYFSGLYVRKNKAMWARYNKFVDTSLIAGKKAVIECYEVVPGPSNLDQYVFSLSVEGFDEKLFAESIDVIKLVLESKRNKALNNDLDNAIAELSKYVGKNLWSAPANIGYEKYGLYFPEGARLFDNLGMVKVLRVVEHTDKSDKKSVLMYVETSDGDVLFKDYSPKKAILSLEVDWYKTDPRKEPAYSHWGQSVWRKIESGTVELGMTGRMVQMAIGYPKDINKTIVRGATTEQWVYEGYKKNRYYYFTNGVLDAIQN